MLMEAAACFRFVSVIHHGLPGIFWFCFILFSFCVVQHSLGELNGNVKGVAALASFKPLGC